MRRARGTGTIERRISSGRVRFLPRLPDRVRTPLGFFDTLREAEVALDEAMKLAGAGLVHDVRRVGAFGLTVIDRRELEGYRNTADERRRWRSYVEPWECASWPLEHVRRRHVAEWLRGLHARGLAEQTQSNALNLLRAVFRAAVDDELLEANPCAEVRVKRRGRVDESSTWLSLDELATLLWAADLEGRHLIAFAAGTGLRQGELRALLASDVHVEGDSPHVIVRFGAPNKPTKNGKIRRVPLFGLALAAAQSWITKRVPGRAPEARCALGEGASVSPAFFFATPSGAARQKGHVLDRDGEKWRAWLRGAGISRVVRWHDLRHTCATLLLLGKLSPEPWSLEAVKEMLGHSSITVTERYAKATGSLAEVAARASATPTVSQSPTDATVTPRDQSRLRDLNSRPTVYEGDAILNDDAGLREAVGVALALLRRAAAGETVSRRLVDVAAGLLEAIDATEVPHPLPIASHGTNLKG